MLIITAKIPRRRIAVGVSVVALLCCATLAINLTRDLTQATSAGVVPDPKGVKTEANRIEYLADWGWDVLPESIMIEELIIPEILDPSYQEYVDMQSQQGFSLEQLTGQRVKRYSYQITNYPTGETDTQVNLLIYKNAVVGGEVLSPRLDGFLHGLAKP